MSTDPAMHPSPTLTLIGTAKLDLSAPVEIGSTAIAPHRTRFIAIQSGSITLTNPSKSSESPLQLSLLPNSSTDIVTILPQYGVVTLDISLLAKPVGAYGPIFRFKNRGTLALDALTGKILKGAPDARSTELGESEILENVRVEVEEGEWGWINFATVVGRGRVVVGEREGVKGLVGIEWEWFKLGAK